MNFNYNTGISTNLSPENSTINSNQNIGANVSTNASTNTLSAENLKPLNKDTVTICGKEVSKKKAIAIGIGGLAAVIGTAAAIIYAIKHHKKIGIHTPNGPSGPTPPTLPGGKTSSISENAKLLSGEPKEIAPIEASAKKFTENSKEMLKRATGCKKRALKASKKVEDTISDVETMFKNNATKTADGRKVEIINNVMTEFADDATTIRRVSTFDNGAPKSIEEFIDATKKNLIEFNSQNKTITYKENLRQVAGDSLHDKEVLLYKGKLNRYIESIKECADGSAQYQKMLDFNPNGNMDVYAEGCEYLSKCEKFAKRLDFEISREMPNEYAEKFVKYLDGKETFGKNLSFIPGVNNPNAYTEKYEKMPDGSTKSKVNAIFNKKGSIIGYEENSIDGEKWDKCFKRSHGKWYMEPSPK